ncbi:hypothetical protein [Rickettsia sp. MEAM1 (Bemisia tabaci)]|uniref:hypothetical protein n=1 Tax=Rickettsia sp. MEAM1 (Bemisia tabaci) TaxID=1182263 RepID=UPI0012FDE6FA|nr:hypothetical protein [Rickettsia sp. MEAM1 (Bemisia tabaci)]
MLLLFYKSFPVIAQYLIYTSLNLTVPPIVPDSFYSMSFPRRRESSIKRDKASF